MVGCAVLVAVTVIVSRSTTAPDAAPTVGFAWVVGSCAGCAACCACADQAVASAPPATVMASAPFHKRRPPVGRLHPSTPYAYASPIAIEPQPVLLLAGWPWGALEAPAAGSLSRASLCGAS